VYSKLKDMETEPGTSDIQDMLRKNKTQMTLDLPGIKEPNSDALNELIEAVRYAGRTGAKFSRHILTEIKASAVHIHGR
jgi:hypothetical protein